VLLHDSVSVIQLNTVLTVCGYTNVSVHGRCICLVGQDFVRILTRFYKWDFIKWFTFTFVKPGRLSYHDTRDSVLNLYVFFLFYFIVFPVVGSRNQN
jgi:hypothetical protein